MKTVVRWLVSAVLLCSAGRAGAALIQVPDPLSGENPVYPLVAREQPAVGAPFTDDHFGTTICRVTQADGNTGRHEYSRFDPFNADRSMVLLIQTSHGGGANVFRTSTVPYNQAANLVTYIGHLTEVRWDPVDPNRVWGLSGFRIVTLDVVTGQQSVIKDFALDPTVGPVLAAASDLDTVTMKDEGEPSLDRRFWALAITGPTRLGFILCWDRATDAVLGLYAVPTAERAIDWVGMSPKGNWVLIGGLDWNGGNLVGLTLANRALTEFHRLDFTTAHADVGLDVRGNEVIVMQNNRTDAVDIIPLSTSTLPILDSGGSYEGTNRVPLVRLCYSDSLPYGLEGATGIHVSGNAPGYCVISTYTSSAAPEKNWIERTITLSVLDPTQPRVYYLAKVHNTKGDYWEETQSALTNDGRKVVWACNWGLDLGQQQLSLMELDIPLPPAPLTLAVAPQIVFEGAAAVAALTRPADQADGALTVALTSSDTSEAVVPESATIPAGEISVTFTVTAPADQAVDGWQLARIEAVAAGLPAASAMVGVTDVDAPIHDLLFIHHSVGANWLDHSLREAVLAKPYIDECTEITYGSDVEPDTGRPDSLAETPGDLTDMQHWVRWFNDYFGALKAYGCETGVNRIVMFKSCFPNSGLTEDGTEPGDPFSETPSLANRKAVYRHPAGRGQTYLHDGQTYQPLEDVFAANPATLFIPVTAPPLQYAPEDGTDDAAGHRARLFNTWLKDEWLPAYNAAHPALHNVAVFDLFDLLAYPGTALSHPDRLRAEYGGDTGDAHPNAVANAMLTMEFATGPDDFLDAAWQAFAAGGQPPEHDPAITTHPRSQTVSVGEAVEFRVVATGTAPLGYEWLKNGTPLPDAHAPTYPIPAATMADAGSYRCRVTNAVDTAESNDAVLTVQEFPDADTDGMDDRWEQAHGGNLAPDADLDGDGYTNLQEFHRRTDPGRYVLVLTRGWNLVSIARVPANNSVQHLLGTAVLYPVWVWVVDHYEAATELLPERGHWVYALAPAQIDVPLP